MVSCHGNGVAASAGDGAPEVLPPPASASGSCCPTRHRACLWDLQRPASYSSTGLGAKWAEVCQRGLPGQLLLVSGPYTAVGAHTGVHETSLVKLIYFSPIPCRPVSLSQKSFLFTQLREPKFIPTAMAFWKWFSSQSTASRKASQAWRQQTHLLRVMFSRERRVVTLLDLLAEGEEVHFISIEGALESCHLRGKGGIRKVSFQP